MAGETSRRHRRPGGGHHDGGRPRPGVSTRSESVGGRRGWRTSSSTRFCSDPTRGPNLREVLNYYGEKNKIFGELRSRPKPASAFNAGCADNGKEDITDLPACYRPGAGFNLNEELAKNPELIGGSGAGPPRTLGST